MGPFSYTIGSVVALSEVEVLTTAEVNEEAFGKTNYSENTNLL